MRILVIILLTLLTIVQSRGQEVTKQDLFKPFSIIVFKPEKAIVPDSLKVYADFIERKHLDMYRASIHAAESIIVREGEEKRDQVDAQIRSIKQRQTEDADFKYYHTIADKTFWEIRTLFNSNEFETDYSLDNPIVTGRVVDYSHSKPRKLARLHKVDYFVTFDNVRCEGDRTTPTLKYVVKLYSTKARKQIMNQEVEGNATLNNFKALGQILPPGNTHESSVHCDNYLECMIKSAVRFSTEELFNEIKGRQKK